MELRRDFRVKADPFSLYLNNRIKSLVTWKITWVLLIQTLVKAQILRQCPLSSSKCLPRPETCPDKSWTKTPTLHRRTPNSTDRAWTESSLAKEGLPWVIPTKTTWNHRERACHRRTSTQTITRPQTQNQWWCLKPSISKETTWQIRIQTGPTRGRTPTQFKVPLASIKRPWAWIWLEPTSRLETKLRKLPLSTPSWRTNSRRSNNKCNLSKF